MESLKKKMTLETPKKEHHHHHHHGGKGHHMQMKPETGTTEECHNVAEAIATSNSAYACDEIKALREELEIESKMR